MAPGARVWEWSTRNYTAAVAAQMRRCKSLALGHGFCSVRTGKEVAENLEKRAAEEGRDGLKFSSLPIPLPYPPTHPPLISSKNELQTPGHLLDRRCPTQFTQTESENFIGGGGGTADAFSLQGHVGAKGRCLRPRHQTQPRLAVAGENKHAVSLSLRQPQGPKEAPHPKQPKSQRESPLHPRDRRETTERGLDRSLCKRNLIRSFPRPLAVRIWRNRTHAHTSAQTDNRPRVKKSRPKAHRGFRRTRNRRHRAAPGENQKGDDDREGATGQRSFLHTLLLPSSIPILLSKPACLLALPRICLLRAFSLYASFFSFGSISLQPSPDRLALSGSLQSVFQAAHPAVRWSA
ncbi:hypothetical protein MRX96_041019 [Rhipicephalus microplus]